MPTPSDVANKDQSIRHIEPRNYSGLPTPGNRVAAVFVLIVIVIVIVITGFSARKKGEITITIKRWEGAEVAHGSWVCSVQRRRVAGTRTSAPIAFYFVLALQRSRSLAISAGWAAGRISMGPPLTTGCLDISSIAWFKSLASMIKKPANCSLVSA